MLIDLKTEIVRLYNCMFERCFTASAHLVEPAFFTLAFENCVTVPRNLPNQAEKEYNQTLVFTADLMPPDFLQHHSWLTRQPFLPSAQKSASFRDLKQEIGIFSHFKQFSSR